MNWTKPVLTGAAALLTAMHSPSIHATASRPNVLFIGVDDLRPEIRSFGAAHMFTPHIDSLAERGVRFDRAYCNNAVCGASRASLMSGLRSTPNRFITAGTRVSVDAPDVLTMAAAFKQDGYHTISNGKVYHHNDDDPQAWSEPAWRPEWRWYATDEARILDAREGHRGPAFESSPGDESEHPDARIAERTIDDLRRLSGQEEPFFLACGFMKPHLPFVAPEEFWELYPPETIDRPDNMYFPVGMSEAFMYHWGELRRYDSIPKQGPVASETAHNLIRGYRACVSFVDAQVGRLLEEIDALGIADETIIVLWSDHGFQLGEHGFWCKHTDFEVATHVPLIIVAPGVEPNRSTMRLVEYVDLYPTLCDLAGIPKPDHLQGKSLLPLLHDTDAEHKRAIFTHHWMSDAVRTDRYRYMEIRADGGVGELLGTALFDLKADPGQNRNVINEPAYSEVLKDLRNCLDQHLAERQ